MRRKWSEVFGGVGRRHRYPVPPFTPASKEQMEAVDRLLENWGYISSTPRTPINQESQKDGENETGD